MATDKLKSRGRTAVARGPIAEEYSELYEFAPIIWMVLDANGVVRDINPAGLQALQVGRDFIVGTPLRIWIDHEHRALQVDHMRRCRATDELVETRLRLRARSGAVLTVRLHSISSRANGMLVFPSVAIDISEQETLEQARRAAERQRDLAEHERRAARAAEAAKDRLIATVSHELRNPLTPALMAASTLAGWPELPDHVRQMAVIIKRNIQLEARLIDDLLDVARATRGQLELRVQVHDVHVILHQAMDAVAGAARARSITITEDFHQGPRHVRADDVRLQQVFWNLLNNAVKFSEPGGQVLVRTSAGADDVLVVTVRDYGTGIDAPTLERLFTPFEQPRVPVGGIAGLGLGLSIARNIVDLHGGQIWASSEGPGTGATFEVQLPLVKCDAVETAKLAESAPRPKSTAKGEALIIEDHPDSGAMLSACLSQEGYAVTVVSTLAQGLSQLRKHWDVVLSDIGLGDGTGLDIARSASASRRPPLHLIALSGFGTVADIQASHDAGFDHHLVKPVDPAQLLKLLA
jgi:PAS domain S-box-containing protein